MVLGTLGKKKAPHGDIAAALVDRGYLPAPEIAELWRAGVQLRSRAFRASTNGLFGKGHFKLLLDGGVALCPSGNEPCGCTEPANANNLATPLGPCTCSRPGHEKGLRPVTGALLLKAMLAVR